MAKSARKVKVVTGVVGEDVHIVGIRVIEQALSAAGFEVISLGAQVSPEEFVEAAVRNGADAIFVSSFSGHAEKWVSGMRAMCQRNGIGGILLYIGGYLLTTEEPWEETEKRCKGLGFDRVYPPRTSADSVIKDFVEDLKQRGKLGED